MCQRDCLLVRSHQKVITIPTNAVVLPTTVRAFYDLVIPPGFEPGLLPWKSSVLTSWPRDHIQGTIKNFYTKNLLSKILLYVPLWSLVSLGRFELPVHWLKVSCVTSYATGSNGAAGGNRTHMVLLPRDFPATLGYDFPSHLNRCCSLDYVFSISLLT